MHSPLTDLFKDLKDVLDKSAINWYVFGAQAAIIHGASRLTADVDVTILYGERPLEDLVSDLQNGGFNIRVENAVVFIQHSKVLPVIHVNSGMPVDIVFGGPGLEEQFSRRSQRFDFNGIEVPIASCEDIIAMKILSGRGKDLEDALAIIEAQSANLNIKQVQSTLELLESVLDRNDLLPVLLNLIHKAQ